MKKIINGRKYDTETADLIYNYTNNLPCNDFRHLEETLYRKKNGEFFLHGEGGAMTKYAQSNGNTTWGGEAITPLTEGEAQELCEENLTVEEFEKIFGTVSE